MRFDWEFFARCGLLGLLFSASLPPAGAGSGPTLAARWAARAPVLDGFIAPGEWDPFPIDLGGAHLYIMNDGRTLYLAVVNHDDLDYQFGDRLTVLFDDEGGIAPPLWDNLWTATVCGGTNAGEGILDLDDIFAGGNNYFQILAGFTFCPGQAGTVGAAIRSALRANGVTYEAAIPLDGSTALGAAPGQEFGLAVVVEDGGAPIAQKQWPSPLYLTSPSSFANVLVATLGCNAPTETFDDVPESTWSVTDNAGSGLVWTATGGSGYPSDCAEDNYTGGSGSAACTSGQAFGPAPFDTQLISSPFRLDGFSSASLRFQANYQDLLSGGDVLTVEVSDDLGSSWIPLLSWDEGHGTYNSAPGESVELDLSSFVGATAPLQVRWTYADPNLWFLGAYYAQIDDVELRCGPEIFRDGFETGLTSHWSAQAP